MKIYAIRDNKLVELSSRVYQKDQVPNHCAQCGSSQIFPPRGYNKFYTCGSCGAMHRVAPSMEEMRAPVEMAATSFVS